jgi:Cu(I)/Ag(I) efflux system membrane protein CusA/SilA
MLRATIRFSAEHRFLVIAAAIVALAASWHAMRTMPLDALPDLADTQVIVTARWERSPDLVEAQVTWPVVSALLGAPKVKAIRGFSDFGASFIYVIFEEDRKSVV